MHTATPPRSPHVSPAQAQADRLAWLFRGGDGGPGPAHPLLQPLACLRDLGDAAVLIPPPPTQLPQPQPPRHTIDRAWLHDRVDALPALPQAVLAAMRVLQQDDSSTAQCAAALGRDNSEQR